MLNYAEYPDLSSKDLQRWWDLNKNVLIYGGHGVGKTSIIKAFWDSLGIKYAVFSGATLDPWTDLVGIPYRVERDGLSFIEYALPQTMDADLEAIFIDEINRAGEKTRNALLELLLNRSINGRKFPKLRAVWAAANPPDSQNNYDVEELDPAQEDRFPIIIKIPDEPSLSYFTGKYGQAVAQQAIRWHANLPEDLRRLISPRRLDFAVEHVAIHEGNARDVFPHKSINVTAFTKAVRGDDRMKELVAAVNGRKTNAIKMFFGNDLKVQGCLREIVSQYKYAKHLAQYAGIEQLMGIVESDPGLSLILADTSRPEKDKAIDDYRLLHKQDPDWHVRGISESSRARNLTNIFAEELEFFPTMSLTPLKIPDLTVSLASKEAVQALEDFRAPAGLFACEVDEESARNGLKFAIRVFSSTDPAKAFPKDQAVKFYSIIYSSLNFYYERDGHLIGAIYDNPGSENVITILPKGVRPAPKKVIQKSAPPILPPGVVATRRFNPKVETNLF